MIPITLGILGQVALAVLVFAVGSFFSYWLPEFLKFFFRRIVRIEIDYVETWSENESKRYENGHDQVYLEGSYFRTNFFLLIYILIRLLLIFSTITVTVWILHDDLWFILAGLGAYSLIAIFHLGDYLRNMSAYVWLVATAQVKLGQIVQVGPAMGRVIDFTSMHVILWGPTRLPSLPYRYYSSRSQASSPLRPPGLQQPFQTLRQRTLPAPPVNAEDDVAAFTEGDNGKNGFITVPNINFLTYNVSIQATPSTLPAHNRSPEGVVFS